MSIFDQLNKPNIVSGRQSHSRRYPPFRFAGLRLLSTLVLTLSLLGLATNLYAAPVTFTAGGTLDSVDPSLTGTFSVGDSFTITLSYDDATPDTLPSTTYGIYHDPIVALSGTIGGGYAFSWSPPAVAGTVSGINLPVDNSMDILIDDVSPSGWTAASVAGMVPQFANIPLTDGDGPGGFLGTDALPSTVPTFSQIGSSSNFRLRFGPTWNENEVRGSFDFIDPVSTTTRIAGVGANNGNQAANTVCSSGDLDCTIVRIDEATFNAMTPAQLRAAYDVLIFTWNSNSSLNGDWTTRVKPYLDLGGGVIWEDNNNIGDLAPEISGENADAGGDISVIAAVPGLTDGISDNFVNTHTRTTLYSASFAPFLLDNSNGNTVGIYGGTSSGCMVVTGPDQDFHSSRGAGGAAGNQYNLLVNEIAWVSACAGFVNTAPEAVDDAYGTLEDMILNVAAPGVLSNDSDANGDPLTAVEDTSTSNGSLTLNADGSFDYDPDSNYCGTDSFTYHANDGMDDSNVATVTITVTCVNDQPSFSTLGDQTVPEDSGAQTVPGFASASPGGGADEAGQTFTYNIVGNSNPGLFFAAPAISPSGELTYESGLNAFGSSTITVSVTDSGGTDNGGVDTSAEQNFNINITPVNDAPVANDDAYDAIEDTQLVVAAPGVLANDTDVDGDVLSVFSNAQASHGTVVVSADGSFTYDPNLNYCGPDSFTYIATDAPPQNGSALNSNVATVSLTVACVNDPPVVTSVVPDAQSSDYSDNIAQVVITVEDVDNVSTTLAESDEPPLSAAGLTLTSTGCIVDNTESPDEDGSSCTWNYNGTVLDPGDNVHVIVFTPSDGDGAGTVTGTHTLTIEPEDATVLLDADNEVAIQVESEGGNSGEFHLFFSAWETMPDLAGGSPLPGDLNEMVPYIELVPIGPGGPETGVCSFIAATNPLDGYDQEASFDCVFDDIPVNTYEINAWVDGASDTTRYYIGSDDGVLSIFDPSLGFTTGGGWFYWPGTADPALITCGEDGYAGDKTNFGFNMKYNKKKTNVQGSLLLQRHTVDANCEGAGKYRVKSNALDGLSIGDATDANGDYGWAAFGGKSKFNEPGIDGSGNHPFLVYVEDHDDQGCNQDPTDDFWIQVKDKDGIVVLEVNGPDSDPAGEDGEDGDDEAIQCGNIIVPHSNKGGGKP